MSDVLVRLSDLDAERVETESGVWFALGLNGDLLSHFPHGHLDASAASELIRRQRDAVVIFLRTVDGRATSLVAWRGILSGRDLYYTLLEDGTFVLSDHFRDVIAYVPVERRSLSGDALLEHYLGGWVYDRRSYSRGVGRVAAGDRLDVDLPSGSVALQLFDRIEPCSEEEGVVDVVDRVEEALEKSASPLQKAGDVCIAFSGGVDSTLLASFLDDRVPLIAMTPDSPEFLGETEYARAASRLLGRDLVEHPVYERDYLRLLEDTTDQLGTPPRHHVVPMLSALYERPESTFLIGEGADSVFGSGRGLQRIAGIVTGGPSRAALGLLRRLPGRVGARGAQLRSYADLFAQPPSSLDGHAGRSLTEGDTAVVESIVGSDEVRRLLQLQMQGVVDRVGLEMDESRRFDRHIEMTQWRYTLGDLATIDRHLALANGKRVVLPYTSQAVVTELLSVPADRRYIKGLSGKWILKEILARRVPGYPVGQRKYATGLPFERYYESGPLADFWERYDVPDFVPQGARELVVGSPNPIGWQALTHAVWSDRIERNPDLKPLSSALEHRVLIRSS